MISPASRSGILPTLAIAALTALLSACGGGDDASTKLVRVPNASLQLTPGPVSIEAGGATPGALSDADRDAIVGVMTRYVDAATIRPLKGDPVGKLDTLFTPAALASMTGSSRDAMVDPTLPTASGGLKAEANPLPLSVLTDGNGAVVLVGTSLALDVRAPTKKGPVHVQRLGEVVLVRDADAWRITSFKMNVTRSGPGISTTTTSVPTPGASTTDPVGS